MKRPRVTVRCAASHYQTADQRIIEFTFPSGSGGLISFAHDDVTIYRFDAPVSVTVSGGQDARIRVTREGDNLIRVFKS